MKEDDDGREFCEMSLVVRDSKPRRQGLWDDLFAAMPKESIVCTRCRVREKRREQGQEEKKLMFSDVEKAHLNATCDEELCQETGE